MNNLLDFALLTCYKTMPSFTKSSKLFIEVECHLMTNGFNSHILFSAKVKCLINNNRE